MLTHTLISEALPAPACDEGLGNHCPAQFELVASSCRPGETDATLRCRDCGAQRHFVLDAAGNVIHDSGRPEAGSLKEYRHQMPETGGQVESAPRAPGEESPLPPPPHAAAPAEAG